MLNGYGTLLPYSGCTEITASYVKQKNHLDEKEREGGLEMKKAATHLFWRRTTSPRGGPDWMFSCLPSSTSYPSTIIVTHSFASVAFHYSVLVPNDEHFNGH